MTDFKYKVLLYSDGSHQAFSAAVYTATLLKIIPNMHLTVVQVHERDEVSMETEYSWINTWPVSPTSEWMKHVLDGSDTETKSEYHKILNKTNEIFLEHGLSVSHQELYSNSKISEISDTVDVILDYATKNLFELIVMGSRGLSSLKGLIFGSVAHYVLNKSEIPVLLIKKLPQDFIDNYLADTEV
ncbi:universal stress protein [Desulfosporosinus sp. OT]|uniref:universal stress protein n=1 Tax=Desulfosporosinus sp. OT TaxID=913865 RepID=UPI0002239B5A|nr:universal stress protein [Desulfosporosinus sp. OT]EGW39537.1 universal stress family protein [Desulfosporosinus sp. OT]